MAEQKWLHGNPIVGTGEVIHEVITAEDGQGFGAVVDIKRSPRHYHPHMLETYHLISGIARVHLDDREQIMRTPGESLEIKPGVRHWVESIGDTPLRIAVHTFPAWTLAENILAEN